MGRKKQTTGQGDAAGDEPAKPAKLGKAKRLVQLDTDLHRKIGVIASWRGMSVPDYVNNMLLPIVAKEFPAAVEEMGLEGDAQDD